MCPPGCASRRSVSRQRAPAGCLTVGRRISAPSSRCLALCCFRCSLSRCCGEAAGGRRGNASRPFFVIPAQNEIRHTRAKKGPSYPRSPRVSRRVQHRALLQNALASPCGRKGPEWRERIWGGARLWAGWRSRCCSRWRARRWASRAAGKVRRRRTGGVRWRSPSVSSTPARCSTPARSRAGAATATAKRTRRRGASARSARARSHTCGLRETGEIECWGANHFEPSRRTSRRFSALSAGNRSHRCGLRETGAVECWGSNGYGQGRMRRRDASARSAPAERYTCALLEAGAVECWGRNNWDGRNERADGALQRAQRPAGSTPAGCARRARSSAGDTTKTAKRTRRRGASARSARAGRTAAGCARRARSSAGEATAPAKRTRRRGASAQSALARSHTCGLRETGAVECWGGNDRGETDVPAWLREPMLAVPATGSGGLLDRGGEAPRAGLAVFGAALLSLLALALLRRGRRRS